MPTEQLDPAQFGMDVLVQASIVGWPLGRTGRFSALLTQPGRVVLYYLQGGSVFDGAGELIQPAGARTPADHDVRM